MPKAPGSIPGIPKWDQNKSKREGRLCTHLTLKGNLGVLEPRDTTKSDHATASVERFIEGSVRWGCRGGLSKSGRTREGREGLAFYKRI